MSTNLAAGKRPMHMRYPGDRSVWGGGGVPLPSSNGVFTSSDVLLLFPSNSFEGMIRCT